MKKVTQLYKIVQKKTTAFHDDGLALSCAQIILRGAFPA